MSTAGAVSSAVEALTATDPVLARLVEIHGPPPHRKPVPVGLRFAELARMIVYQQLAGRAAATIHGRFSAALSGSVTPDAVLSAAPEVLTGAGLSRAKAASVTDLARHVVDGRVVLDRIGRLEDEAVIDHLTVVRGVGPWTAHMVLIFMLARPDVWPTGDFGVRAGFRRAWGLLDVPTPGELDALGERFRPYRSLVAWYCWRVMDEPVTTLAATSPGQRPAR